MQEKNLIFFKKLEEQLVKLDKEFETVMAETTILANKISDIRNELNTIVHGVKTQGFPNKSESNFDHEVENLSEPCSEHSLGVSAETIPEVPSSKTNLKINPPEENSSSKDNDNPIEIRYCSVLLGQGFDYIDSSDTIGLRSIYVIEIMSPKTARFYPIADNATRIINNRQELLDPVCEADDNINPNDFKITSEEYGTLCLEEPNRWVVVKRCRISAK